MEEGDEVVRKVIDFHHGLITIFTFGRFTINYHWSVSSVVTALTLGKLFLMTLAISFQL